MSYAETCFICDEDLNNGLLVIKVKNKGIDGLIRKSKEIKDNKWQSLEKLTEVQVHAQCRVRYSLLKTKNVIPIEEVQVEDRYEYFDFEANCFLCTKPWIPKYKPGRRVTSVEFQTYLTNYIDKRDDAWSLAVKNTIENVPLLDVKARYHTSCYEKFKYVPKDPTTEPKISGIDIAFESVCSFIEESDDSQFFLSELMEQMGDHRCAAPTLKQKLRNKYGKDILIIEHKGKPTIVCFLDVGHKVLVDSWYNKREKTEKEERLRIIRAAGDIICEDIRSKVYETSYYPPPGELLQNVETDIPETLLVLLDKILLKGKKSRKEKHITQRNSIAHSIVSIVRSRSFISSVQLATGVYLNRKFGSRLIIDILCNLGFCTSYTNVSLYEASVLNSGKKFTTDFYAQYVFDNADHNVCTLDGFNTFHSMGGICCVTPRSAVSTEGQIKKLVSMPKAEELVSKFRVPIKPYGRFNTNQLGLKSITFSDVSKLNLDCRQKLPTTYSTHILSKLFDIPNIPSWRGYMENISQSMEYNVSQVYCLPFINLPPSNMDTINTVLHLALRESRKHHIKTCFVTFDQPLYIKAREIKANDSALNNLVIRLGGFHLLMSFIGSIGTIMDGSGLKEVLSTIYAGNTIDHMLTGHAFSRAIRGHLIVYSALGIIIAKKTGDIDNEIGKKNCRSAH